MNIKNKSNGKIKNKLSLQAFEILIWTILSSSSDNEYVLAKREILFHSFTKKLYAQVAFKLVKNSKRFLHNI
jgi:hypothetical protein